MITTVTLNPAIDKTIVLDILKHGEVNRTKKFRQDLGGKGINVAKVLSCLGESVNSVGFMGIDNYEEIKQLLSSQTFQSDYVLVDGTTRTNTKIVELETKTTTDINELGFEVSQADLTNILDKIINYSKKSDYVILSGSLPKGVPNTFYYDIIEKIKDDTTVVLDVDGGILVNVLEAGPDIIKPNIHELEDAVGYSINSDKEVIKIGLEWIEKYKLTYILVSMGKNGSLLINDKAIYKALPINIDVKGTVGAGDSMLAGFVYGLINHDVEKALAYGAACGTLAVSKEGTEIFKETEVHQMLEKIQLQDMSYFLN